MSSQYDVAWRKIFADVGGFGSVLHRVRSGEVVFVPAEELRKHGKRGDWGGNVLLTREGVLGDPGSVAAHVRALKNVLPEHIFPDEQIKCVMSRRGGQLTLTLRLLGAEAIPMRKVTLVKPEGPLARIRKEVIMWNDYSYEDIVGEDRTIDKFELVRDFLNTSNCKETLLASPESLSNFLKNEIKRKFGVYCIYNEDKREVLDVGKSKNLKARIREQLIGVKSRKDITRPLKFPRLFFAFLKREYNGMKEKEYNKLPDSKKKEYVESFQNKIFKSNNILRVFFTKDHLRAIVLEHTLIKYFKSKNQCKYNFQV